MTRDRYVQAVFPAVFTIAALLVQLHVGAYSSDRGQTNDEAAHFVTSLMLSDYLHHFGNPVAFAKSYYVHLPRVAIGHWPPVFEILQSLTFDIFGGTNTVALALQAVILGLLAGLPAALMARRFGIAAGLLTGLIILCSRYILFLLDTVMSDNLCGLLTFLSAWAWSCLYRERSWRAAAAFAATAAAAVLTKGNGYGLALLPVIYAAMKRDWRFLFDAKVLSAGAVILVLTIPWYVATYRLAAAGFFYSWGWSYTSHAVPVFLKAFPAEFGWPGTLAFFYGFVRLGRAPGNDGLDLRAFAATAAAMFLFILLVPCDMTSRYLIPIYPCAAMVAVWGILDLLERLLPSTAPMARQGLAALVVLLSIWQGFYPPHVESFHSQEVVDRIALLPQKNPLILISGSPRFEGAMVASVAQADRGRFLYALRASKLLSSSSFIGAGYQPRFSSAAEMKSWLVANRIGWVVIDSASESMAFSHNGMLLAVVNDDPQTFRLVWRGVRSDGTATLFATPFAAAVPDHSEKLLAEQTPGQ